MIFDTKVAGIPCQVKVTHYSPGVPAKLNGHPDNATEAEPEEFEYELLDKDGKRITDLWDISDEDEDRLLEEFHITVLEEKHGYEP